MRRRRLGVQAAITRPGGNAELLGCFLRSKRRHLSIETKDASVNDRFTHPYARVVDEIARWEIVRSVDAYFEVIKDGFDVLTRNAVLKRNDFHVGVEIGERFLCAFDLGRTQA